MIRSIADLVGRLATAGSTTIDATYTKRSDYIGDMYEGLAGELLRLQFPDDIGLSLVEGQLIGENGKLSDQKDWVLVKGEVERLPFSDHYNIPLWQAVAVFEIKKRFTPGNIAEYFEKLCRLNDLYDKFPARQNALESCIARCRGYRPFYERDPFGFGKTEDDLRLSILEDISLPLRIGIGFHGPKKWQTFRNNCLGALGRESIAGALHLLPSLLISGNHSLQKTCGSPFVFSVRPEISVNYSTSHGDPWLLLAKLIWWRLIEEHGYRWPVYADDDVPEDSLPLLATLMSSGVTGGIGLDPRIAPRATGEPEPIYEVSIQAQGLIMALNVLDHHWYPENEPILSEIFAEERCTLPEITEELLRTGLYRRGKRDGSTVIYQVPVSLGGWKTPDRRAFICDDTFHRAIRSHIAEVSATDPGKTLHIFTHQGVPVGAYEYQLGPDNPGAEFENVRLVAMLDAAKSISKRVYEDDVEKLDLDTT